MQDVWCLRKKEICEAGAWCVALSAKRPFGVEVVGGPEKVSRAMQAFRKALSENDMLAYLSMMAPRLLELRRVLSPMGSIYLHCDPTASQYLKMLMDGVFCPGNFKNEIVWKRTNAHSDSATCGNAHDILLLYTRGDTFVWNKQYQGYDDSYVESHYRYIDSEGRRYRTDNLTAGGLSGGGYEYKWRGVKRVWRCPKKRMAELEREGRIKYTKTGTAEYVRYLDEMPGVPLQDVWTDIPPINPQAKERLGYPTQKPEALLERIMMASSNEGETVLDPFCGCGTTIAVAQRLKRRWIGIDITHLAIGLIKHRLHNAFGEKVKKGYKVIGEPSDLAGAKQLAQEDKFQFECWALGLVGARSAEKKRGADRGIDGRLYFHDEGEGARTKQIVLSVKGGHTGPGDVRDLRGVVEGEEAEMGVFICLQKPTREMRREAGSCKYYKSPWRKGPYPGLQILTIEELLNGRKVESPPLGQVNVTFKKAPREKGKKEKHPEFDY